MNRRTRCRKTPLLGLARLLAVAGLLIPAGCGGLSEREASLFEQCRAALDARDWARAEANLSAVLNTSPDFTPAQFLRGRTRFELRRFDESLKDLATAQASGELTEEERLASTVYRGRCLLEEGREISPDTEFRDRKSTRLNSSHIQKSRMPSSA